MAIGKGVEVDRSPLTIIGVKPTSFKLTAADSALLIVCFNLIICKFPLFLSA